MRVFNQLGLRACLRRFSHSDGFSFRELPVKTIFELTTQNHFYTIVAIEPNQSKLILMGHNELVKEPIICHFNGSTLGGSAIRPDWVGIGLRLEFQLEPRRELVLSELKSYRFFLDSDQVNEMIERANSK